MKLYFSRKSLSHIKVWEASIDVFLMNGENFTATFDNALEKAHWENTLSKMLLENGGYTGVAWYDSDSGKIYF